MVTRTRSRILLATIGAAHGVRGEVRVKTFTQDPLALGDYGALLARDGRTFAVERLRPGKEVVIAKFRGVDDRNAAEALNGVELFVERAALPSPAEADEFYHADLLGLAAETESGEALGTVVAIHDHGAGDILEIAPARGPALLAPFTKSTVPLIDIPGGRIVVSPPAEAEQDECEGEEFS